MLESGHLASRIPTNCSKNDLYRRWGNPGFSDRILLAKFGPAANFARLLIVFALAKLLVQTASFEELFESAQSRTDRFFIVHAHP
jgi:hypothetical protein